MIPNLISSLLCIVDIQEKLIGAMGCPQEMLKRSKILLEASRALGLPMVATEQYPRGLGPTLPEIRELFAEGTPVIEKIHFSCFGAEGFRSAVAVSEAKNLILIGIESHVCVLQTALDALALGKTVYLAEDCVDSRYASDKASALAYMRNEGVKVLTSEMLLFLFLRDASHPCFKTISQLIK
ncbi:MAG: Isochorismatase family protein [Lentisphaerae bacterium ADurb.Bin242]|nr:MAG: Isochorismatase family protein [Lentisphaerae bacterium ADurb.Bin242]